MSFSKASFSSASFWQSLTKSCSCTKQGQTFPTNRGERVKSIVKFWCRIHLEFVIKFVENEKDLKKRASTTLPRHTWRAWRVYQTVQLQKTEEITCMNMPYMNWKKLMCEANRMKSNPLCNRQVCVCQALDYGINTQNPSTEKNVN